MKKALLLTALFSVYWGNLNAKCLPSTVVAEVGSDKITYSYFNYVKSQIPKWAWKNYYGENPRKLLEKIIDRTLILVDHERRGFFKNPEVKEKLEAFKIKSLAYSLLNSELKGIKISKKELNEVLSRYPKEKRTPTLVKSLKASLLAKEFTLKREELFKKAYSRLKVFTLNPSSPEDLVAEYKGRKIYFKDLKPLLPEKPSKEEVKKALSLYSLYLQAEEKGLDRRETFKNSLESFKEALAVEDFKRELFPKIKITEEEVHRYYESHRKQFKTPERAKVKVFGVSSLKEGRELLREVKEGAPLKGGKILEVRKGEDNPISLFVFGMNENTGLLRLSDGRLVLIKVLKRIPSRELSFGDAYWEVRSKLYSEKVKRTLNEELSKLKREYKVKEMNLTCLREKDSY